MGFPLEMQGQTEGVYPVYKVGDVSRGVLLDGGILRRSTNYVDAEAAAVLKGHIFPEGSILFAKIGEALRLNRRAIIFREGLADNNVMGFKAAQGIDDGFLYHFLRTQDLASLSRSTTIPSIRKSDVEDITISLPPLAEQKRIAQKLDALLAQVDTLKARIDAIPALLKRFRQAILSSAISGHLTKKWRLEIEPPVPINGRSMNLLSNISRLITSGSRGWGEYYASTGAIFIRSQDINTDELSLESAALVQPPKTSEGKRTRVEPQDLLVTITGANVGKVARVRYTIAEAYVSQHVALIRLNDPSLASFIELYLKDVGSGRGILHDLAYGGGKPGLNLSNLRELEIPLPGEEERAEIVRRVEQLFAYADQLETKVAAAKQRIDALTQSLLAKAFRGELVPQDPTDEPASALLERIRAQRAATPKPKRGRKAATS